MSVRFVPESELEQYARRAPWSNQVFHLLEKGPRTLDEVIAEARAYVPPGRALRTRENDVKRYRARSEGKGHKRSKSDEDRIRVGARMIIMDSINSFVARGKLEKYEDNEGVIWLRKGSNSPPLSKQLTAMETQVLSLVSLGYTQPEVAEKLNVSIRTVESHRAKLKEKLGLETRHDIVAYALKHGLMD